MKYTVADWKSGKQLPKGWDVADAERDGWSSDDIVAFIKKYITTPKPSAPSSPPVGGAPRAKTTTQAKQTSQAKPAEVVDIRTKAKLASDEHWKTQLVFNADGVPKPTSTNNHQLYLAHHHEIRGMLSLNEFSREIIVHRCPPWKNPDNWEPRPILEDDNVDIVAWLERVGRLSPKVSGIFSVVSSVAGKNSYDPLREYLENLRWDGKPRVADFLQDYLGARDNTGYSRIISKRWLISAVARALKPGCKMDNMLVLEGPQGALKSTAIPVLFGDEFWTDQISDFNSKDAKQEIQGVWAVEVAEMDRVTKAEQDQVKKFLSHRVDRYRPPYGRHVVSAPRRCVLVGTINPDGTGYLKDSTGARRFWPMKVGHIDIEAIKRDRNQIWAEAVMFYQSGEKWWIQPDEKDTVEEQQAYRTEPDAWEELLGDAIQLLDDNITMSQCIKWLNLPSERVELRHTMRIGRVLKSLGFDRHRLQSEDGQWTSRYVRRKKPE